MKTDGEQEGKTHRKTARKKGTHAPMEGWERRRNEQISSSS